jgi:ABC-type glycerol-3-phosphate transport system substrate-binding protein
VQITYWEKWTGHEALAMQRVVDDFNQSQSRVFVRFLSMTMIEQKAMIAIAGGNPPDVVGLYNKNLRLFAEAGAILPLGELAGRHTLTSEHYADAIWRLCTLRPRRNAEDTIDREELFGLPNTCSTMALYYNRELVPRPPLTIAELDDMARRLTTPARGGETAAQLGFVPTEPGWWPHVWGYFFGASMYDEASDRATAADPANVRAYEWVQSFPRRFGVESMLNFQSGLGSYSSAQQPLLDGRVAMCLHGPFLVNVIKQFKPDFPFGVAPFPVDTIEPDDANPVGLVEADVLAIPSGCEHVEEAMEFMAFTQRSDIAERLAIAHAKPSPLAACSREYYASHPNPQIRVHEAIARSTRGFGYPSTRVWNEYESMLRRAFESEIWQLRRPASDVLRDVQARAQQAIDRASEKQRRRRARDASRRASLDAPARDRGPA